MQQTRRARARATHRKDARHPTAWHLEQTAKMARMEITTDGGSSRDRGYPARPVWSGYLRPGHNLL